MRSATALALAFGFSAAIGRLDAQTSTSTPSASGNSASVSLVHASRPQVAATVATEPIHIDGALTELDWSRAAPITHFIQVEPNAGHDPSERTDVRILLTADALVIGARMYDSNVLALRPRLTRRDDSKPSDRLTITLDPFHNHRTASRFTVTPAGSLADASIGAAPDGDPSWDPVWEAATVISDSGWTAELRIPLSQLRYSTGGDSWGLQIERFILRTQERDVFAFIPQTERGLVEHFGHLAGMSGARATRNIELLPYVSERASYLAPANTNSLVKSSDGRTRVGGDLRYGVSSSLTLNASVNPDFGQVEVDPAVVNLTAFETVFPEKRPFFVEGNEFFEFGRIRSYNQLAAPQLFYSRRIGRVPQLAPPNAGSAFATTVPGQTDILVASKLTGRNASGWSVGALHALTDEARGQALLSDGVATGVVEPRTNFVVARTTRDFNSAATTVGAIATSVDRSLDDSSSRYLRASSRLVGVDLHHAWDGRRWALDGDFSASSVHGTANAIALTQRSSTHYFQRPDRSDVQFDPTRTSLGGYTGQLAVTKLRGNWVGSLVYQDVSPGFEVNDIGLERLAGRHMLSTDFHYQSYTPGKLFNNFIIWPFTNHSWDYDRTPLKNPAVPTYNFWFQGQLRNFWNVVWWNGYTPRFVDGELTRGGPSGRNPMTRLYHAEIRTSDRRAVSASVVAQTEVQEQDGRKSTLSGGVSWRPVPNALIRIDPSFSAVRDPRQFLQRIGPASSLTAPVGGALFGSIQRRTLSLDTRADWTFNPKLTLQLYLQPFVDAGRYDTFSQLRSHRSMDYQTFGREIGTVTKNADNSSQIDPDGPGPLAGFRLPNPDYNVRALRGNAVLRWEYRPGSTLYVVWQQLRTGQDAYGDFRLSRDLRGLGRLPTDNVFLVKGTYWLSF